MPIRVLARGGILVSDFRALDASPRRFIGRTPKATDAGVEWQADAQPAELPDVGEFGSEFVREVREGSLWPADAETARRCGVSFDPKFGGEFAAPAAVKE